MPLPLAVSCFSKIQIGFTFLVPAHLVSPGKRAVERVCVCVCVCVQLYQTTRSQWQAWQRTSPPWCVRTHTHRRTDSAKTYCLHCSAIYCMSRGIKNEIIVGQNNVTIPACMPLLKATSTFGLERRRWSSSQQCYLHCICTI